MPSSFPTLPSPSRMSRLLSPTHPNPPIIPFLSCLTDAHCHFFFKLFTVLTLAQTLYNHSWRKLQDLGAARSAKSTSGSFLKLVMYCCIVVNENTVLLTRTLACAPTLVFIFNPHPRCWCGLHSDLIPAGVSQFFNVISAGSEMERSQEAFDSYGRKKNLGKKRHRGRLCLR